MNYIIAILIPIGIITFGIWWAFFAEPESPIVPKNEKEKKQNGEKIVPRLSEQNNEVKEEHIISQVSKNIRSQGNKAVETQINEATYRKLDLVIKAIIAFILMCILFVSCGIKTGIGYLDTIRVSPADFYFDVRTH